jgi:hypothetical protein
MLVVVFLGIFAITALSTYFLHEDTVLLEKQIASRQKDVGIMLQLRNSYEMKKRAFEKTPKGAEQQSLSLAAIEEMVAKSFVGGKLASLQPTTAKEKGPQKMSVEVKITGAPLGEVISFMKAAENSGLVVGRLRLSLPDANPMALDVQATITDRRSHG